MTEFEPKRTDRVRAMAVLLFACSAALALLYVPLLRPWFIVERERWFLQARIADAQDVLRRSSVIDAEFSRRREQLLTSGLYLSESSLPLATASLTQRLQQAASDAATDDSVCVMGNRVPKGSQQSTSSCQEARVQASMQCGGVALQRFLHAIEVTAPRLRIDHLTVGLAANPLGFDQPMASNQPLNVTVEVSGCLFPDALTMGDHRTGL